MRRLKTSLSSGSGGGWEDRPWLETTSETKRLAVPDLEDSRSCSHNKLSLLQRQLDGRCSEDTWAQQNMDLHLSLSLCYSAGCTGADYTPTGDKQVFKNAVCTLSLVALFISSSVQFVVSVFESAFLKLILLSLEPFDVSTRSYVHELRESRSVCQSVSMCEREGALQKVAHIIKMEFISVPCEVTTSMVILWLEVIKTNQTKQREHWICVHTRIKYDFYIKLHDSHWHETAADYWMKFSSLWKEWIVEKK